MLDFVVGKISAQMVTRLLIVSYFVAMALGQISSIEVARLAETFLPPEQASLVMSGLILALAGMVLFGFFRRPAALVLALIVFWSSYITLFSGGGIEAFWRDLALIGGLLLTANVTTYADRALAVDDEDEALQDAEWTAAAANGLDPTQIEPEFREDFKVARAS
ncbi:MAG: hypothetical protein AAFY06_04965 [Pseudomonadota bacterium]